VVGQNWTVNFNGAGSCTELCVEGPMKLKARGLAKHGGPPGWLEESDPAGVISNMMDGLFHLPFP
jgi:hypothetical protein